MSRFIIMPVLAFNVAVANAAAKVGSELQEQTAKIRQVLQISDSSPVSRDYIGVTPEGRECRLSVNLNDKAYSFNIYVCDPSVAYQQPCDVRTFDEPINAIEYREPLYSNEYGVYGFQKSQAKFSKLGLGNDLWITIRTESSADQYISNAQYKVVLRKSGDLLSLSGELWRREGAKLLLHDNTNISTELVGCLNMSPVKK